MVFEHALYFIYQILNIRLQKLKTILEMHFTSAIVGDSLRICPLL